jgi:hypothetical protein
MKILIFILMAPLAVMVTRVNAEQKIFKDGVGINYDCVAMPVGRVLLIGRDNFLGAVKFLQNEERADGTYSKYDYFEYEKGGFWFRWQGQISLKKYTGKGSFLHPIPYNDAGDPLRVGKFNLYAVAFKEHSTVYFWSKPKKVDHKVRMAPTPWREIEEVKLSDPRIKWFAYDERREWKVIPIDKIWD